MGLASQPEPADFELAEVAGYSDWWKAAPSELTEEFGIRSMEIRGAICCAVGAMSGSRLVNHVIGLGRVASPSSKELDSIAEFYADVGVQYAVAVSDAAERDDLASRLLERGFAEDYAWVKFRRGVEPARGIETDLRVEEVSSDHAHAFGEIVVSGFDLPRALAAWFAAIVGRRGWRCYLAFADGVPAATGALFVHGRMAWVSFAATVPEFRRRGAQSALLERRIADAVSAGCESLVTETGEIVDGKPSNSYRNILRAGFEVAYRRRNLLSPT